MEGYIYKHTSPSGKSYVGQTEVISKDKNLTRINRRFGNGRILCTSCKAKKTYLERLGVTSPLKSPEIIEKKKQTELDRYGNDPEFRKIAVENSKKTMKERYGVEYYTEIINKGKGE